MNKKIAFCLYSWPCVAPHTLISLHFWHTLVKLDIKKASLSWRARTHKLQKYPLCLVKQTGNPLQNHKEYSQHNVNMFIDFNKYKVWNQNAVAKPENIILIWFGCETPCYHKKKASILASTNHKYWSNKAKCCTYRKYSSLNAELGNWCERKSSRVLHSSELPNGLRYSPTTQISCNINSNEGIWCLITGLLNTIHYRPTCNNSFNTHWIFDVISFVSSQSFTWTYVPITFRWEWNETLSFRASKPAKRLGKTNLRIGYWITSSNSSKYETFSIIYKEHTAHENIYYSTR